jgi:hypothetical protein
VRNPIKIKMNRINKNKFEYLFSRKSPLPRHCKEGDRGDFFLYVKKKVSSESVIQIIIDKIIDHDADKLKIE